MKNYLTIILLFLFTSVHGQKKKTYFPIWTFHQKNINIYGVSVGLGSLRDEPKLTNNNGLKLEIIGAGILVAFIPHSPVAENDSSFQQLQKDTISERINGISLSLSGTVCDCIINGISLGLIGHIEYKVNGLSATLLNFAQIHNGIQLGLTNETYKMTGLQIGLANISKRTKGIQIGLWNINETDRMTGLQIGLVNSSKRTKGIQIGLWNVNEKRKFPLFNWNF